MSDSGKNKTVIGAFVVGAVVLAVVGVIIFGGGKAFEKTSHFVMYFNESVKGLSIGAPVTFRGVKIGSVTDVTVRANPETMEFRIPVVIEVEADKIEKTVETALDTDQALKKLIEVGLRAGLNPQSMVTGQLMVNLELLPDEPQRLSGIKHEYPEIPTVPSDFERLTKKIENLPIDEMLKKASGTLTALEAFLVNPALTEIVNHLKQASANAQQLTENLNHQVTPLVGSFQRIADHADRLILNVDDQIKPLAGSATSTLKNTSAAVDSIHRAADAFTELFTRAQPVIAEAGQALANVADLTSSNAKERSELRTMLKELSEAARSIRNWSTYMERHPEAFIYGKGKSKRR